MKRVFEEIVALILLAIIVFLGYCAWQSGYIGVENGKLWVNLSAKTNNAYSPFSPTPIVTLPAPEDFPSDVGGNSVFAFVEASTPLPPICSVFSCRVELANDFWPNLPGAQGYATTGNIVAAGIDIVHSALNEQSVPEWDWYADTHKRVIATVRVFARAAIDPQKIKVVLNESGDGVLVTVKPPEMCLDSAGIAMVDPSEGRPVEVRLEVAQSYSPVYDTCINGNYFACGAGVYGNPEFDSMKMGQAALQTAANEAMSLIAQSNGFKQAYIDSITGQRAPEKSQNEESLSVNTDQWGQPIATTASDVLVLFGKAVACDVLSQTGRPCDPSLMHVVIEAPTYSSQLYYCNGRPFTTGAVDITAIEKWLPELTTPSGD